MHDDPIHTMHIKPPIYQIGCSSKTFVQIILAATVMTFAFSSVSILLQFSQQMFRCQLCFSPRPIPIGSIVHRLIRPSWAKHSRHSPELNLLLPIFVSRHCTCHHLTQPAGLTSLHLGAGSMSFYDNAAGTLAEGWLKEPALLCPSKCY